MNTDRDSESLIRRTVEALEQTGRFHELRRYAQHGGITVYDHCVSVARTALRVARRLPGRFDPPSLVRGALLHDYFLYDWHHHDEKWHGFTHPYEAARNAKRDFDLTDTEEDIIKSHMWPLTPLTVPKTREAMLVCIADKICSLRETLLKR